MRYEVTEQDSTVQIQVRHTAGRTEQLLASMQDCQEGRCSCPTDRYDRLAAMAVTVGDDEVTVRLEPQPGEHLDPDELRACLDYTLAHTEQ